MNEAFVERLVQWLRQDAHAARGDAAAASSGHPGAGKADTDRVADDQEDPSANVGRAEHLMEAADRCWSLGDPAAAERGWADSIRLLAPTTGAEGEEPRSADVESRACRVQARAFRRLAERSLDAGAGTVAVQRADAAADLFRLAGDPGAAIECGRIAGRAALAAGRLDQARDEFDRGLLAAGSVDARDWLPGLYLLDLSELKLLIGDPAGSRADAWQARSLLNGLPLEQTRSDVLRARACLELKDLPGSWAALDDGGHQLMRALTSGAAGPFDQACLDAAIGELLLAVGDVDRAAELFATAAQTFRAHQAWEGEAHCRLYEGDIAVLQGNYQQALELYAGAGEFFRDRGDAIQAASCQHGQAVAQLHLAQEVQRQNPTVETAGDAETGAAFVLERQALSTLHGVVHQLPTYRARERWRQQIGQAYRFAFDLAAQGLKDAVLVAQLVELCVVTGTFDLSGPDDDSGPRARLLVDRGADSDADRRPAPPGRGGLAMTAPPALWWTPGVPLPGSARPGESGGKEPLPTW